MNGPADTRVSHRPEASRFEVDVPGGPALCVYRRQGDVLLLTHTEVPPALEGRGIAAALVLALALGRSADARLFRPPHARIGLDGIGGFLCARAFAPRLAL